MTNLIVLIIIAAIGGVAVAFQAQFTGLLDKNMGTLESVFITYGGGGALVGLIMLTQRGANLSAWRNAPWYTFAAGALGLVIIGTISYTVPRLGLVTAFTILVTTQFTIGALIDHFGLLGATVRPLDLSRLAGIVVLLLGTWLIVR